ncbi:hypothetical protein B0H19DRAFT_1265773 [Mycena capillaripes]|nr:hypothetical protein B0H19DRAFT_1265773 [Mycena capillaripes]
MGVFPDVAAGASPHGGQQYTALRVLQHLPIYKHEGRGRLYANACVDDADIVAFRAGDLPQHEFLAGVKVKVGHTCDLDRRQSEYLACDVGQTHLWAFYYDVEKRYLAERMVHLRLFEKGGCER